MTPVQPVRGTQSLLGEDADRLAAVVAAFDRVRRLYGFRRVEVPTIEQTAVFARTIGETTDVVSKEMYSFEDRGGESITLRPEFTAGICRAYLSEGWQQYRAAEGRDPRLGLPLRAAAEGPLPRVPPARRRDHRRRRAAGRCRAARLRRPAAEGARHRRRDPQAQHARRSGDARRLARCAVRAFPRRIAAALSEDSQARLERNPLRILDSKAHQDWPIVDSAPAIDDFLTAEAADFFGKVTAGLDAAGIAWERAPRLVRGLDYYRHTAFEFVTDRLGAQGTVLAGGRYDGLIEALGGPHTPAVGWAAGIERLAMMIDAPEPETADGRDRSARASAPKLQAQRHRLPSFAAPALPRTWPIAAT